MGRVCTELPQADHHGPHPVSVHTRLPTPSVPLDGRTLLHSNCRPLVPSEGVWDSAHVHLQQAVRRHKAFADCRRSNAPIYRTGDKVWLSTRDLHLRLPCRKLSPRYIGPFTIQRQINEVTLLLKLPARYHIHPAFHISLLKPFSPSAPGPDEPTVPPPPEVMAEPSIYRVRNITDSRQGGGHQEYLIDWEGYGPEDLGWPRIMFRIPPFWQNSITTTQTVLHPEAVAIPVAVVGHQEPPLEEGVLSGSRSHQSRHQLCSSDPNPLITDHHHLSPLIRSTISLHSSCTVIVWSQTLHVYVPDSYLLLPTS